MSKVIRIAQVLPTSLCDWSSKLVSRPSPIRCKTYTNRDLVTRVFPRFRQLAYNDFDFSLAPLEIFFASIGRCDNLFRFSQHSIEMHLKIEFLLIELSSRNRWSFSRGWNCLVVVRSSQTNLPRIDLFRLLQSQRAQVRNSSCILVCV